MNDIQELVSGLKDKNNKYAYQCLKQLELESLNTDAVYSYFDLFSAMLDDSNSYIRTRGILLIAANAKWDSDYKIDEIIDRLLKHIMMISRLPQGRQLRLCPLSQSISQISLTISVMRCIKQILRFIGAVCSH